MAKKGYGGYLGGFVSSALYSVVRETLVVMGLKKGHRGGARLGPARKLVQGKDRYGREKRK